MKSGSDPTFQMEGRRAKIKSNGLVSITFSTMSASICGPSRNNLYPRDEYYCLFMIEYQHTVFPLAITRMTYSFLSNKYNENWIVNDDPCKEAMTIALGFNFGTVEIHFLSLNRRYDIVSHIKTTMVGNIPSFVLQGMAQGFGPNYFNPDCMPFGCGEIKYPGFMEEQPTTEIGTTRDLGTDFVHLE